jgi:hypothetical protein
MCIFLEDGPSVGQITGLLDHRSQNIDRTIGVYTPTEPFCKLKLSKFVIKNVVRDTYTQNLKILVLNYCFVFPKISKFQNS